MLTIILTNLKTMGKLLDIPRFWGPVGTVIFTIAYHLAANYFGFTITYGWLWLALVAGVFIGGLRAGLLCGVWVTLYAVWTVPFTDDPSRVIQIGLVSVIGAWLVGFLRRRERHLQMAINLAFSNGNVAKMRETLDLARNLKVNLSTYSEAEILEIIEQIESLAGNTLAVLDGYKVLREEIERVNKWYADPANVKKLQEMRTDA